MKKLCLAFLALAVLLAACAPAPAAATLTPTASQPTDTPEPTAEPTPSVPESISRYESILRQLGLTVTVVGQEVQVVNKDNEPVLVSAEAAAITIQTEDGETLTFPEEALEMRQTIAIGYKNILTINDDQGNTQYFYLKETGLWATPLELQTNPKDPEQYILIDLEDVWSGRLVISVALEAEAFPAGTVVPDELAYMLWQGLGGGSVRMQGFVNGALDSQAEYWQHVNQKNDYRLPLAFWRFVTEDGTKAIGGTEQILLPGGQEYAFLTGIHGPESSWVEGRQFPDGKRNNIADTAFAYRDPSFDTNTFVAFLIRPLIALGPGLQGLAGTYGNLRNAQAKSVGFDLYLNNPQNNPLSLRPDLSGLIEERLANPLGRIDYLAPVGKEIAGMQLMVLVYTSSGEIFPIYFQTPNH
ncbi:MAG: hypothetical protein KJZ53_08115 [Anaerolineales bacterium]|nr:hypothetical protein [Anaerolineales bacterium]